MTDGNVPTRTLSRYKAELGLLFVAFIWGVTFTTVKSALSGITPLFFLAIRFAIAFAFLALVYWRKWKTLNQSTLLAGLLIGLFLFAGYALQTVGLKYTTASNAGFITGLSVVLVPVFTVFLTRKAPPFACCLGVIMAVVGLGLLSFGDSLSLNKGDLLVLGCAVAYALHIIMVGIYAPRFDPALLTVIQIGFVAVASAIGGVLTEPLPRQLNEAVWFALLFTAIPATSLAFLIQNQLQRFTSANRTAIILTMEPVFAALSGVLLLNEVLTGRSLAGCALILSGMLISGWKQEEKEAGMACQPGSGVARTTRP